VQGQITNSAHLQVGRRRLGDDHAALQRDPNVVDGT
jgi:hypothetical protein